MGKTMSDMTRIGDLLARDLKKPIEEIIKVNQADEQTVYDEITEYVATPSIRQEYRDLLQAMADAPSEPTEGIGVWISGFFGSGKSSFAKNLGYVLSNREILGHRAAELFKHQVGDERISELIDFVNARIPTDVIMFDVMVDHAVQTQNEKIAEIMYRVLLRELGYAQDFTIADLEIELEREGKLDHFTEICAAKYGDWRQIRSGAQRFSRASAILHEMEPGTYPEIDSYSNIIRGKQIPVTVATLVERTFELAARRRPGKAIVFIVDEVGQYVARSADKLEDLRAVVEQFGKESKNRVKASKAVAPVWVIVTSQEKLAEVVDAIASRRVELAKLQDRFKHSIDLSPADIRQVATERVLKKRSEAEPILAQLFEANQGRLNAACQLERTALPSEVGKRDFIRFYPYLPHFIDLSIEIMSGIRLQPGAPKHLGGSNRTIIKQAHSMLTNKHTRLADKPVGRLVSLDLLYEIVHANLSSERQTDINQISERLGRDPEDGGWSTRVAKALTLLEFVRDLPRTEKNIAAVLVDEVGQPAAVGQVKAALERLVEAQFVAWGQEGYKLLTREEKRWEEDRAAHLNPKPRERHEIVRGALGDIFEDPKLTAFRYQNVRTFRIAVVVDDTRLSAGQIPLTLIAADAPEELTQEIDEARQESWMPTHQHDLYWIFALTAGINRLVTELHASNTTLA